MGHFLDNGINELPKEMQDRLKQNGVNELFPVQDSVFNLFVQEENELIVK